MAGRITDLFIWCVVLASAGILISCGAGVPEGPGTLGDGRIIVENSTESSMSVTYTDEELGQVELVVEGGETKDVYGKVLAAGTEVTVRVEALDATRPHAEVPVTVDGDVTIQIISFGPWGSGELEYRIRHSRGVRGPGGASRIFKDGRIFMENRANVPMDVSYVNEELGRIRTQVDPGQTLDISQALLKGGTEVKLTVKSVVMYSSTVVIPITVEGNITIRITPKEGSSTHFEYTIVRT